MTALDDLRAAVRATEDYSDLALVYPFQKLLVAARAVVALPDYEVPEGKVLVDEADLRHVQAMLAGGRSFDHTYSAFVRLVAALPAPEWEPSDELVERWRETLGCTSTELRCSKCSKCSGTIKLLHAAGLLNPEVTDG